MTLIIPGVEVKVVKEVVAPQLSPSGILGLVGITEKVPPASPVQVNSWNSFIDQFGNASAYSLPEAGLALANGVSELVIAPVKHSSSAASVTLPRDNGTALTLTARAPGPWAKGLVVKITKRPGTEQTFDLTLCDADSRTMETHRDLVLDKTKAKYVETVLDAAPSLLKADSIEAGNLPKEGSYPLMGGADCEATAYTDALRSLEDDPDIDMVLVALQDFTHATEIYSAVVSHCTRMAALSQGRIGFGQVPPTGTIKQWEAMASNLVSDRFVLVAPNGVVGAVAGMIGSLDYFESPTFKTLTGLTTLSQTLRVEDQEGLLNANIVPVITQRGRGTIVVRGLTTDGDQISVRRVADHAMRGVKMIGDLFIGRLNDERGRDALKQKLIEFLVQMERDGAIVPSTDGKDPAFKVNVYASEDDFSKGIVRVDMAVRPVRAIDYIYATVLVQV